MRGIWHDPRQDVIAAPGVGELGVGDEKFSEKDVDRTPAGALALKETHMIPGVDDVDRNGPKSKGQPETEQSAVRAMPLIVLRNFSSSTGASGRDAVMDVLARWAATLAEGGLAHVVVLADNREDSRALAKALPARPLVSVALTDADAASARSLMQSRLRLAGAKDTLTEQELLAIDKLGGRTSDLAGVLRKVRAGASVEAAVEEIVARGAGELRKTAFGDENQFEAKGGLKTMGVAFEAGMVLVLSLWDDYAVNMLWLDSDYPTTADPSTPGIARGNCSTTSGVPADVESQSGSAKGTCSIKKCDTAVTNIIHSYLLRHQDRPYRLDVLIAQIVKTAARSVGLQLAVSHYVSHSLLAYPLTLCLQYNGFFLLTL